MSYAYFGNAGLYCYSMDGELLWDLNWEPQPVRMDFGTGSSPVVHGGRVYILRDTFGESYLAAVDAKTGKELWRTPRQTDSPFRKTDGPRPSSGRTATHRDHCRRSPTRHKLRPQGQRDLAALRHHRGHSDASRRARRCSTSPRARKARKAAPYSQYVPAPRVTSRLKEGETSNDYVAWHHPRASAYIPSPLLYQGYLYFVRDNGILSVFDAKTGERLYRARVGGGGHTFASSPWAYDGKVFFLSEDGDTFVAQPGKTYEEIGKNSLGRNELGEPSHLR